MRKIYAIFIAIIILTSNSAFCQSPGDVTGKGTETTSDTLMIVDYLTSKTTLSEIQKEQADSNRDVKIDIADVVYLINPTLSPTPTPTQSPGPGSTPSPTPSPALTPTPSITPSPTATPTPSISPSPTPTPQPTPEEVTINLPGDIPLVLVKIPKGSFQMGSPDTERGRYINESPLHTVNINYDFYMGKYELTQKQWIAVMKSWPGTVPSSTYGRGNNFPAYYISWDDCQNFMTALNAHVTATGQGPATFRLPSEAEWEYACCAGTQTRFYFGDSLDCADDCSDCAAGTLPGNRSDYMWYCGNNGSSGTSNYGSKSVGTKLPNPFGLYDMNGNVYEWCQDWYHDSYTGAPTDGSAWESPTGSKRILRGGDWQSNSLFCRSSHRLPYSSFRSFNYGVRVLRTP